MGAKTAISLWCVSVSAGHVMGKPALVDIDNGSASLFVRLNLFLEDTPLLGIGPRVFKGFLYMSH